jgi:uncharacterized protein (DUF58 family)
VPGRAWTALAIGLLLLSVPLRHGLLFALALVLLLTALVSLLWSRRCLDGVEYRRRLGQRRAFFGEEVELVVEIVNRKLLPLAWLEAEDELPSDLAPENAPLVGTHNRGRGRLVNLLSLRPYERVRRHYRLVCRARGEHVLGPLRLRSGDPFGFHTAEVVSTEPDYLLVYPRVLPLERLGLPSRDPFGELRTRSWLFEDPLRIVGARDYTPSDSPRRIHWPATARAGRLQVKLYQPTTSHRLVVVLNLNTVGPDWWAQGYDPDLLELAITTAASLAAWAAERGYQVGLSANGSLRRLGGQVRIPPGRDPDQLGRVLEALARSLPFASRSLGVLLREEARALPYGSTLVVVTSRLDENALAELRVLGAAGNRVVLLLIGERAPDAAPRGVRVLRVAPAASWRDLDALAPSLSASGRP